MVLKLLAALMLAMVVLTGCRDRLQTREKVQEAIVQRLQKSSGLDMKGLDITTTSVTFEKTKAYATVAFHPKDDPTVNNGMTMKYTLEERDGQWAVVSVADSQGHGLGGGHGAASGNPLPAGHPPVDAASPGTPMASPHATAPSNGQAR